jgi:hypothetical protein
MDEFYDILDEVREEVNDHHDPRIRKNFTNAIDACVESFESSLNMAGIMYLHDFLSFKEYSEFTKLLIKAHKAYITFTASKLSD